MAKAGSVISATPPDIYGEVLAYALRRLRERGAAEDVAAQTFAVAWRRLDALPADPLPPRRRPPCDPKRGSFSAANKQRSTRSTPDPKSTAVGMAGP
jgi:hypothetical protein